jgi:hypothetical protein
VACRPTCWGETPQPNGTILRQAREFTNRPFPAPLVARTALIRCGYTGGSRTRSSNISLGLMSFASARANRRPATVSLPGPFGL